MEHFNRIYDKKMAQGTSIEQIPIENRRNYLMITNGASRIDKEFGIETLLRHQVSEYSFSSWASTDVAQANEKHRERFCLCF